MKTCQVSDTSKQLNSPNSSISVNNNHNLTVEFKQYSDKYFYSVLTDNKLKKKKKNTMMDMSMDTTTLTSIRMDHLTAPVGVDSNMRTLILQNKLLKLYNYNQNENNSKDDKDIDRAMRKIDAIAILESKVQKRLSTRRIIADCRRDNLSSKEK